MPKLHNPPIGGSGSVPIQIPLSGAGPHDLTMYSAGEYRFVVDSSTGAIVVNMPAADAGLDVEVVNRGANTVTCVPDGTDTVNDAAGNMVLNAYPEAMHFKGEAGNWNTTMPLVA